MIDEEKKEERKVEEKACYATEEVDVSRYVDEGNGNGMVSTTTLSQNV